MYIGTARGVQYLINAPTEGQPVQTDLVSAWANQIVAIRRPRRPRHPVLTPLSEEPSWRFSRSPATPPPGRADRHAPMVGPTERVPLASWAPSWSSAAAGTSPCGPPPRAGHHRHHRHHRRPPPRPPLHGLGPHIRPPSTGLAVTVFVALTGLLLFAATLLAILTHTRIQGRRPGKGLASAADIDREASEQRARRAGAYTRGTRFTGTDGRLDTRALRAAPLREFGFILGHAQPSGRPVVLSHDDSAGVLATTGAGKTRNFIVRPAWKRSARWY